MPGPPGRRDELRPRRDEPREDGGGSAGVVQCRPGAARRGRGPAGAGRHAADFGDRGSDVLSRVVRIAPRSGRCWPSGGGACSAGDPERLRGLAERHCGLRRGRFLRAPPSARAGSSATQARRSRGQAGPAAAARSSRVRRRQAQARSPARPSQVPYRPSHEACSRVSTPSASTAEVQRRGHVQDRPAHCAIALILGASPEMNDRSTLTAAYGNRLT